MKKIAFLLSILFSFSKFLNAQDLSADSAWLVTHYHKIERSIPMRDGVKLFTAIYIPNDSSEKHPILMTRTPYSCAPYGTDFTNWWKSLRMVYFRENYIVVFQDVRGCYMSEGKFEEVRPFNPHKKGKNDIDEASDSYDAIDWLVKNVSHNNGNVGVFGISYPGFYSTMAAMSGHPALKAVSPQAPVTDWFIGDDFHHKGVLFEMDAFNFERSFGVPRYGPRKSGPPIPPVGGDDNYQFFLQAGALKNISPKYMGDTIAFWKDMMAHGTYDTFWQERNARKYISNLKPAILLVGGLFDAEDCYGTWNVFKTIEKQSPNTINKIAMGPWAHNNWKLYGRDRLGNVYFSDKTSDYFQTQIELPFFNYYLKGTGNGKDLPKASIYVSGEDKWRQFDQWPPKQVTSQSLYLRESGKVSYEKQNSPNSYDEYISDPAKPVPYTEDVHKNRTREYMTDDQRFASRRPDVLVYETDTLQSDLTLTGPVIADIFASISTTDADFVVKVIDVFPDNFKYPDSLKMTYPMGGYQMLVRGEIMRGKFRNSFVKPEAFNPNQIAEVKFELPDVAHTFQKGHRLMVQVQSSWFPLADRNPQQFTNIYTCDDRDFVKSTIRIYHDAAHPSNLLLPVLDR